MHLTVGYLATATGDDGIALASALAKTFDASVDILLVVREELPDGHPGRLEYQKLLIERGEQWVSRAVAALAAHGVTAESTVTVGESFAQSLIESSQLVAEPHSWSHYNVEHDSRGPLIVDASRG